MSATERIGRMVEEAQKARQETKAETVTAREDQSMSEQDDNRQAQSEALGRALAEAMNGDLLHPAREDQRRTCPNCKERFSDWIAHMLTCPKQRVVEETPATEDQPRPTPRCQNPCLLDGAELLGTVTYDPKEQTMTFVRPGEAQGEAPQVCNSRFVDSHFDGSEHICQRQKGHEGACEDAEMLWKTEQAGAHPSQDAHRGPLCDNCGKSSTLHYCWRGDDYKGEVSTYHPSELRGARSTPPLQEKGIENDERMAGRNLSGCGGSADDSVYLGELAKTPAPKVAPSLPAQDAPIQKLWELRDDVEMFIQHDGGIGSIDYDAAKTFHSRHRMMQTAVQLRGKSGGSTPSPDRKVDLDFRSITERVDEMLERAAPSPDPPHYCNISSTMIQGDKTEWTCPECGVTWRWKSQ